MFRARSQLSGRSPSACCVVSREAGAGWFTGSGRCRSAKCTAQARRRWGSASDVGACQEWRRQLPCPELPGCLRLADPALVRERQWNFEAADTPVLPLLQKLAGEGWRLGREAAGPSARAFACRSGPVLAHCVRPLPPCVPRSLPACGFSSLLRSTARDGSQASIGRFLCIRLLCAVSYTHLTLPTKA